MQGQEILLAVIVAYLCMLIFYYYIHIGISNINNKDTCCLTESSPCNYKITCNYMPPKYLIDQYNFDYFEYIYFKASHGI